jgi:hypothetical protein
MIAKYTFTAEEIPYQDFESIGISKQQVLNMPPEVLKKLIHGELTPLMELKPEDRQGRAVSIPSKLRLVRDKDNRPLLMAYPLHKEILNDMKLKDSEIENLRKGSVILHETRNANMRKLSYVQLDKETNCLLTSDARRLSLKERLDEVEHVKDVTLGTNQKQALREGKPLEIEIGDSKITVGVDLKSPNGFKQINGDMEEWKRRQEVKWDIENPQVMGYWQTEENKWEYKQVHAQYDLGGKQSEERKRIEQMMKRTAGLRR